MYMTYVVVPVTWKMDSFVENSIKAIREKVGDGKVLCLLCQVVLIHQWQLYFCQEAIGKQLTCVFVDHGLLRKE